MATSAVLWQGGMGSSFKRCFVGVEGLRGCAIMHVLKSAQSLELGPALDSHNRG